jgi:hypothetical protein
LRCGIAGIEPTISSMQFDELAVTH